MPLNQTGPKSVDLEIHIEFELVLSLSLACLFTKMENFDGILVDFL